MFILASTNNSGDSLCSAGKLMLSLVPIFLMVIVSSQLVHSSPISDKLMMRRTPKEDHQSHDEESLLNGKYMNFLNGVRLPDLSRDVKWGNFLPPISYYYDPSTPAYFGPKLIYKEFVYNKRRKRELRTSSKRSSSSSNTPSSNYHPFLMAEMIPGSVKTRHPSIIAVNGCPAYYIADHKGQCRQVFQYTVNFGQRLNKYPNPTPSPPKHKIHLKNFYMHKKQNLRSSTTTENPQIPNVPGRPIQGVHTPPSPPSSSSPRLLMLLRNAAKRFDLTFLKNQSSSSNSGENVNEDKIDKVRRKILSALKIKNREFSKVDELKRSDRNFPNFDSTSTTTSSTTTTTVTTTTSTTTTPDYDD